MEKVIICLLILLIFMWLLVFPDFPWVRPLERICGSYSGVLLCTTLLWFIIDLVTIVVYLLTQK